MARLSFASRNFANSLGRASSIGDWFMNVSLKHGQLNFLMLYILVSISTSSSFCSFAFTQMWWSPEWCRYSHALLLFPCRLVDCCLCWPPSGLFLEIRSSVCSFSHPCVDSATLVTWRLHLPRWRHPDYCSHLKVLGFLQGAAQLVPQTESTGLLI